MARSDSGPCDEPMAPAPEEGPAKGFTSLLFGRRSLSEGLPYRVASAARSKALRRSLAATFILVCFLSLGYGVYANWHELPTYGWNLSYGFLAAAIFLYLGSFALLVLGWNSIMRRIGGPWSIWENTEIYCFSNMLKRVPPSVWFVAGRVYLYRGKGVPASISSLGTFLEIAVIVTSGAVVYLVIRPASLTGIAPLNCLLAAMPALGVATIYLVGNHGTRLWARVAGSAASNPALPLSWANIGRWLLLYSIAWAWGGTVFHCFAASLFRPVQINLADSIAIWAAAGVVGALAFFVPAGLGVREVTLSFLLSFYVPLPVAIVLSALFRIFTMTGETLSSAALLALIRLSGRGSPPSS